jgi:hypothetical protein
LYSGFITVTLLVLLLLLEHIRPPTRLRSLRLLGVGFSRIVEDNKI